MLLFMSTQASDDDSNDGGGDAQDGESEGESEASVQIGKGGDEEDDDDSVIVVTAEELQANKVNITHTVQNRATPPFSLSTKL